MDSLRIVFLVLAATRFFLSVEACGYCFMSCNHQEYTRIKTNDTYHTCSYVCDPGSYYSCWWPEYHNEPCWKFDNAQEGKCYKGVCLISKEYEKKKNKSEGGAMPCERGYDYLSNKRGVFECKYYCQDPPHTIKDLPDGSPCLAVSTATVGGCTSAGYCY
uniref:7DB family n=1 Tax=Argas monolakensis TaxID=34602 RepID=Q09JL1_ARGMO|nr:7DB family [Argas monolakensis]